MRYQGISKEAQMNRETETHSPEGMRAADGDAGLDKRIERMIDAIDACRNCVTRKEGGVCADCALDRAL
jgi:hypothetical protein